MSRIDWMLGWGGGWITYSGRTVALNNRRNQDSSFPIPAVRIGLFPGKDPV